MIRPVITRFAEVVCPVPDPGDPAARGDPASRERIKGVLAEFDLMLAAFGAGARNGLVAAFAALDQGARLYPAARGRRFTRLPGDVADAYLKALMARPGSLGTAVQRLKSLVVMCYYELPEVKQEIGYDPGPFVAAVTRRRLERYGP
jgi:hypothetical protein